MAWIVGLIAFVGFGWLMFTNERFRRFGFGLLAIVAAAVGLLWLSSERSNREYQAERERSLSAISASQLTLTDLNLSQESYGWRISGSVINRSPYPLRGLTLTVFLQECPSATDEQGCIITGQDDAVFYVEVPPGQARELTTSLQLENAATLGSGWSWQYAVTRIEADLQQEP